MNRNERYMQLITGSAQLVGEVGFSQVTTKKLALHNDVSEALIFKYFGTLEKLYDAICEVLIQDFWAYHLTDDIDDRTFIHTFLSTWIQRAIEKPYVYSFYINAEITKPELLVRNNIHFEGLPIILSLKQRLSSLLEVEDDSTIIFMDMLIGSVKQLLLRTLNDSNTSIQPSSYAHLLIHILTK